MKTIFILGIGILTIIGLTIFFDLEFPVHGTAIKISGVGSIIVLTMFLMIYEDQKAVKN